MKKDMTLAAEKHVEMTSTNVINTIISGMKAPVSMLADYYSAVLERKIDVRQTLHLLNAQAAFAMTVFPVDGPLAVRALCLAWFVGAVLKCRRVL